MKYTTIVPVEDGIDYMNYKVKFNAILEFNGTIIKTDDTDNGIKITIDIDTYEFIEKLKNTSIGDIIEISLSK